MKDMLASRRIIGSSNRLSFPMGIMDIEISLNPVEMETRKRMIGGISINFHTVREVCLCKIRGRCDRLLLKDLFDLSCAHKSIGPAFNKSLGIDRMWGRWLERVGQNMNALERVLALDPSPFHEFMSTVEDDFRLASPGEFSESFDEWFGNAYKIAQKDQISFEETQENPLKMRQEPLCPN